MYGDDEIVEEQVETESYNDFGEFDILEMEDYEPDSKLTTEERNALPPEAFGIPDKRKFPLYRKSGEELKPSKSHITHAKGYFSYAGDDSTVLADNILSAERELYALEGKEFEPSDTDMKWYTCTTEYAIYVDNEVDVLGDDYYSEVDTEDVTFVELEADETPEEEEDHTSETSSDVATNDLAEESDENHDDENESDEATRELAEESDENHDDENDADDATSDLINDDDEDLDSDGEEGDPEGGDEEPAPEEPAPEEPPGPVPFKSRSIKRLRRLMSSLADVTTAINERMTQDITDKVYENLITFKSDIKTYNESMSILIDTSAKIDAVEFETQTNELITDIGEKVDVINESIDNSDKKTIKKEDED